MSGTGKPHRFQPGQSGNPNGRPKKNRALTEILEKAGNTTIEVDGERITGKRLVALFLWEAATKGQVKLLDDRELFLATDEWIDVVQFIYKQVDGPPPAQHEIMGEGGGPVLVDHAFMGSLRKMYGDRSSDS